MSSEVCTDALTVAFGQHKQSLVVANIPTWKVSKKNLLVQVKFLLGAQPIYLEEIGH